MISLTPQQAHALAFITEYIANHGYAPSYDEIGKCLGITKSGVNRVIRNLEERGRIRRWPNRSRALEIIDLSRPQPVQMGRQLSSCGTAAERIEPGDLVVIDENRRVWRFTVEHEPKP